MKRNINSYDGLELNNRQDNTNFVGVNSSNFGDMLPNSTVKSPVVPINTMAKNEEIGRAVKHETQELDLMSSNQEEIDRLYQANINKSWTILDKWTNKSMYDQVQEVKKQLFQTSADYRLKFYKTMLDTRLEYLNEKCNAGLKMIKAHYRKQVSSFLMSKMEQLSVEVRDRQISFIEMMKGKYDYSETLRSYPRMKERLMQSIFTEEEKYLSFLDGLLDKFQSIVDEELTRYK